MEKKLFYGVIQAHCGHDYLTLYTEEQIKKEFKEYNINAELPKGEDTFCEDIYWPMGGSNSSATWICELDGEEAAKAFLTQKCWGPDYDDPPAIALAEYIWSIDTEDGCTKEILDKFGLNARDYTQTDDRVEEICTKLGVKSGALYSEALRELRYSEIIK